MQAAVDQARTPGTLLQLEGMVPSLRPAERRVVRTILSDPASVSSRTITDLARDSDTSEATVIRLCREAGFRGYPALRLALAVETSQSGDTGKRIVGTDIETGDDFQEIVAKVGRADVRAIEETIENLDLEVFEHVVEALASAGRIELCGVGASSVVVTDLEQKLRRTGQLVFANCDMHSALSAAALLSDNDLALGVSLSGATRDTVDPLAEAGSRGAVTVAITNFPESPITKVVDHALTTAARETEFRSGTTAGRLAQLAVVDCLFISVVQRTYDRSSAAVEATYEAVRRAR